MGKSDVRSRAAPGRVGGKEWLGNVPTIPRKGVQVDKELLKEAFVRVATALNVPHEEAYNFQIGPCATRDLVCKAIVETNNYYQYLLENGADALTYEDWKKSCKEKQDAKQKARKEHAEKLAAKKENP